MIYRANFKPLIRAIIAASIGVYAETQPAFAQSDASDTDMSQLFALSLEELSKIQVVTASGSPTPLEKAAGVATVITSDDIKAMGSNDLMSVLENVPGMHIGKHPHAEMHKPVIRGITSAFTPQTLFLVNGLPLTSNFTGNIGNVITNLPLRAVERIEIIRGPGSALYGADAYAGVINVITHSPDSLLADGETSHVNTGIAAGSFDTRGAWLQTAARSGDISAAVMLEYQTTEGHREVITHDAQTNLDAVFNTHASLAPGPTSNSLDEGLIRVELQGMDWRFRSGYQYRSNLGNGAGISYALDPHGRYSGYRLNSDFSYFFNNLAPSLKIESRLSFLKTVQDPEKFIWLYPPGAFGGAFPQGFSGNPGYREDQARYDLIAIYRGFEDHSVRMSVGYYWGDMYNVTEFVNFTISDQGQLIPRPGLVDISDTPATYLPEAQRTNRYALLQDEWQFAPNWQLTLGVRADDYSDFGEPINPRLALIWETSPTLTSKLLYGRAFRAPAFVEIYANSPVVVGNLNLTPETIDTWEMAWSWQAAHTLDVGMNVFHYEIDDFITSVPRAGDVRSFFSNVGQRTGNGAELEFTWQPTDTLRLLGNYSYVHAMDDATDTRIADYPMHQVYARAEWLFLPEWKLSPQLNYIGQQERVAADTRKPVDTYTTLDVSVRHQLFATLEAAISIHNLFDTDVREPFPYANPVEIPNDLPLAGRSIMAEMSLSY